MPKKEAKGGWLSTRAKMDLAYVRVYSLHLLQKRIQKIIRREKQGHVVSADDLQAIREAMLQLWHDAHEHTPMGTPLSYEQYIEQAR
jgi:hypothetical protein